MITEEDYVSFEVAKLLKEKGFDDHNIRYGYNEYGKVCEPVVGWRKVDPFYLRPTHQMAIKWLRETHRIDIIIEISDPSVKDRKYYCMIWDGNNNSYILDLFNSYEEAVEAALKYSLENLV